MTALYPGAPEPPLGSIVMARLDEWQWEHVTTFDGSRWQPVHLRGHAIIGQTWAQIGRYGPLELIRWGANY